MDVENSRGLSKMELKPEIKWDFNSTVFHAQNRKKTGPYKGKVIVIRTKTP